jgi:hypothetical protein
VDKLLKRARSMSSPIHANNFLREMLKRKIAKRNRLIKMLRDVYKDIEDIKREIQSNH